MVDGITAAIELADAPEIGIGTGSRMLEDRDGSSVRKRRRHRHRGKQIDVPCASQVLTANTQVSDGYGVIVAELPLQVQAPLMRQRLDVIRRERINVNRASHSGRRRRQDIGVGWKAGTECVRLHLDTVLRHGGALQNAESPSIEHSVSAARHGAATLIQLVSKSKTWCPVIVISIDPAGVDSH